MTTTANRLTAAAALLALILTALTLVAPAADAAWTTWGKRHGASAQVCRETLPGDRVRIKLRLDNRGSDHWHRATIFRDRGGVITEIEVRAAAGRLSRVRSIVLAPGDEAGLTVHEPDGGAAGDMLRPGSLRRC
jgi:hypothetical protein